MSELQGKGRAERWDEMRGVRAGLHRAERWDEFTEAVRDLKKTPCHLLKGNFGNWSGYILNAHTSFYNYGPKHVHFSNAFLHKYKQKVAFYTHQTLNLGLAFLKSQLLGSKRPNKGHLILYCEKFHLNLMSLNELLLDEARYIVYSDNGFFMLGWWNEMLQ